MLGIIKKYIPNAPRPLGDCLARIPYAYRLGYGVDYRRAQNILEQFDSLSNEERRRYIFDRIYRLISFAIENVPFYRRFYAERGFSISQLRSFNDIDKIPIVTKELLQTISLETRSSNRRGRVISHTGGSTGEPFKFYSDPRQIGNEWAHIHRIWRRLGFRQDSLLLTVALEPKKSPVYYDALRHALVLNLHYPREVVVNNFLEIRPKYRQVWFYRGTPSAWAEILSYCELKAPAFLEQLETSFQGSFLASEFPFPHFRNLIERVTKRPSISWYGLSERVFLAWEKSEPYLYEPMHSYGYCETTVAEDGLERLVGTAYWNYSSPFIRYQVDDIVQSVERYDGILCSFKITDGRAGDYIVDKNGQKLSITHLNLSCRESTWRIARCIQVEQTKPGKITLWITPRIPTNIAEVETAFGFDSLNFDCNYKLIERPFLSSSGKVLLRIRPDKSPEQR